MPRRRRNTPKKTPQHRYRRYGTVKGSTRQFSAWVTEEVFQFFDAHAIDEQGQVRSRAEILQALVKAAQQDGAISTITKIR